MSPEPNQPGASAQPDDQSGQTPVIPGRPTAEILKDISELQAKVEREKHEREMHAKTLAHDHVLMNENKAGIDQTIKDAEVNMEYFEQAKAKGLLQGDDLREYQDLRARVEDLKKIRDEVGAKAQAIYEQPGVGDEVMVIGQKENAEMDELADKKKFIEGLGAKVEEFLSEVEKTIEKRDELRKKRKDAWDAFTIARGKVEEMAPNRPFEKNTRLTARDLVIGYYNGNNERMTLDDLRTKLARGEASMGWGRGDEKRRILGLIDSPEFQDAEAKRAKSALAEKEDNEYLLTLDEVGSKIESLRKKWGEEVSEPYRNLQARAEKRFGPNNTDRKKGEQYTAFREAVIKAISDTKEKFYSKYYKDTAQYPTYPSDRSDKGEKGNSVDGLFLRIHKPYEI